MNENVTNIYIIFFCSYYIGRKPFIVVTDLEMIKAITIKDFDYFVDRDVSYSNRNI